MPSPDYIVDIEGLAPQPEAPDAHSSNPGRPWVAIHWRCCSVYSRVYRDATATEYRGQCPKCARKIRLGVGAQGTAARFFEAG